MWEEGGVGLVSSNLLNGVILSGGRKLMVAVVVVVVVGRHGTK